MMQPVHTCTVEREEKRAFSMHAAPEGTLNSER